MPSSILSALFFLLSAPLTTFNESLDKLEGFGGKVLVKALASEYVRGEMRLISTSIRIGRAADGGDRTELSVAFASVSGDCTGSITIAREDVIGCWFDLTNKLDAEKKEEQRRRDA